MKLLPILNLYNKIWDKKDVMVVKIDVEIAKIAKVEAIKISVTEDTAVEAMVPVDSSGRRDHNRASNQPVGMAVVLGYATLPIPIG